MYQNWDQNWLDKAKPSIEYLELFALVAATLAWGVELRNCRVVMYCNNHSVISMINKTTSTCKNCMVLIRLLVLHML